MSAVVTQGTISNLLKNTLDTIVGDDTDGVMSAMIMPKWCEVETMEDAFSDEQEVEGPGLASAKKQAAPMAVGTFRQGLLTRYIAGSFALKLVISHEAQKDNKYPEAIKFARRLKKSMIKTADIMATFMLVRATNTDYVGADGQPLASASHRLGPTGTFSNTFATPLAPSREAVIQMRAALQKMKGYDGITEGYEPKKIVCPADQWAQWDELTLSTKAPEAGQFNAINVVNRLGLEVVPIKYWQNTTTNWGCITDADDGIKFKWRERPNSSTWVDNDGRTMNYGIYARWAMGWTNPRGFWFSNA